MVIFNSYVKLPEGNGYMLISSLTSVWKTSGSVQQMRRVFWNDDLVNTNLNDRQY